MMRLPALLEHRKTLITYLLQKVEEEDFHGVMDAAADLRVLDAEIRVRKELGGETQ